MRIRYAVLLVASISLFAQSPVAHDMTMVTGKGELLQFDRDIVRVVVAEPKIADAIVVSPREVMINAKGPGKTTIMIWEPGAVAGRYNVSVTPDNSDFDNFRKEFRDGFPDSTVSINGNAETLVLTGAVKDVSQSKRAAALASTRAKTVVNLLQTPPAEDPKQILLQVKFASIDRIALQELGFNLVSTTERCWAPPPHSSSRRPALANCRIRTATRTPRLRTSPIC